MLLCPTALVVPLLPKWRASLACRIVLQYGAAGGGTLTKVQVIQDEKNLVGTPSRVDSNQLMTSIFSSERYIPIECEALQEREELRYQRIDVTQ